MVGTAVSNIALVIATQTWVPESQPSGPQVS